ncbi:MAG TPA: hypothetical protein VGH28_24965 [Polyangiaceae bacterium]|jgi:hypothetical protein
MGRLACVGILVLAFACNKGAATSSDAGSAAAASVSATTSASATVVATTATASASAAPTAAPDVTCERPTFKLVQAGKPTVCIKPCGADSDCARGEKCKELGAKLDPKGLEQAEFCFPREGAAPHAKCAAGETLIQARYEPLCSKTCRTNADCGHSGPCVDTPTASGDTAKVCEATGSPPK